MVTTVTYLRRPLFREDAAANIVIGSLNHLHDTKVIRSFAWVVMPDHLHWVIRLGEIPLVTVMRRLKNWTGRELNRLHQCKGRSVWQRGFHDRAVTRDGGLGRAAKYLVGNPVKAGLVDRYGDYPYLFIGDLEPEWDGSMV